MNNTYGHRDRSYTLVVVTDHIHHEAREDAPPSAEVDRCYLGTLLPASREDDVTHTSIVPHTDGHCEAGIAGASPYRIHLYVRGEDLPAISVTVLPTHMASDERRSLVSAVVPTEASDEVLSRAGTRTVLVSLHPSAALAAAVDLGILDKALAWARFLGEKHLRIMDSPIATPSEEERRRNADLVASLHDLEPE